MKKAIVVALIVILGASAFALGREERFGRSTDPAYDFVDDYSVTPTGIWENNFETRFDLNRQAFVPYIAARSCQGIVVYIDYMPIRRIEWAAAKNEAMTTYFEIYVISDQQTPTAVEIGSDDEPEQPAVGPGEIITPRGEVVKLVGAADVGNMVKYRIVGRNVIFDFLNLPPTAKKITIKIQTADTNRYVETNYQPSGSARR